MLAVRWQERGCLDRWRAQRDGRRRAHPVRREEPNRLHRSRTPSGGGQGRSANRWRRQEDDHHRGRSGHGQQEDSVRRWRRDHAQERRREHHPEERRDHHPEGERRLDHRLGKDQRQGRRRRHHQGQQGQQELKALAQVAGRRQPAKIHSLASLSRSSLVCNLPPIVHRSSVTRNSAVIDSTERAYDLHTPKDRWLLEVIERLRPALDSGLGIFGWLYDARDFRNLVFTSPVFLDIPEALPGALVNCSKDPGTPLSLTKMHYRTPAGPFSMSLGDQFAHYAPWRKYVYPLGIKDLLVVNGIDSNRQGCAWECIILDLGFLHTQDIRTMLGEPRNNAIEPLANGVDVPSSDLHADTGRENRTP